MNSAHETIAPGYRVMRRASVISTMDEARVLLAESDGKPFWLVADEQTGGRGRHGRSWSSPPGNLYATLALSAPCDPAVAPQLGFVAGVALHRAVADVAGLSHPELGIKWPNDLLLDGAKVAGLLLEGLQVRGQFCVLIGFGVNIVSAPEGTPYRARPLVSQTSAPTPLSLLEMLSDIWSDEQTRWRTGFAATRAAWLERAALIGETITVRPPSGEQRGVMRGIDETGRLLLETASGSLTVEAGDVFPV